MPHLLVFGLGYTGRAIAAAAAAQGWHVAATSRDPAAVPPPSVAIQPFDRAGSIRGRYTRRTAGGGWRIICPRAAHQRKARVERGG